MEGIRSFPPATKGSRYKRNKNCSPRVNIAPAKRRLMVMNRGGLFTMKRAARFLAVLAVLACAAASPVLAEESQAENAAGIPAYTVARLKVLDGSVWVRTSRDSEWAEFSTNSPIPPGSRLSVPGGSEGELQFHGGQSVLLTSGTDLEIRELKEEKTQFRLRAGEIRFDLPPEDFAPVAIRVPGGSRVQVSQAGQILDRRGRQRPDPRHRPVRRGHGRKGRGGEVPHPRRGAGRHRARGIRQPGSKTSRNRRPHRRPRGPGMTSASPRTSTPNSRITESG